jgi:saccharopine dehydrogenase-like NADP-dependent oxidoreductase
VSTSDAVRDVRALLDLDAEARERDRSVVVGAGFAPGLSCVLARRAAAQFDTVDEIHVAKSGTGGPRARQHHQALGGSAIDWRDGVFVERPRVRPRAVLVPRSDRWAGLLPRALPAR